MAANSKIEWTHHTFNPWWGCVKVSPACTHCYAETWAKRTGKKVWGPKSERRFFSDAHWKQPIQWNNDAVANGDRYRVFCASMADVFENRDDLDPHRERLWNLIENTPNLDWLLLTKRPELVNSKVRWNGDWPNNVWLGATVENQEYARQRIPHLIKTKARVKFLSCEPMLGKIVLSNEALRKIDWVIAGGESGGKSRPMDLTALRSLRDQCRQAKIAFHFKQWGNWVPENQFKGTELDNGNVSPMIRTSKVKAGRVLDGRTWDQYPF